MFEEKVELKTVSPDKAFLIVVFAVLVLYGISLFNLPFKGILVLVLFMILSALVYKYIYSGLKEFYYVIDEDDVFSVREKIGTKDVITVEVPITDVKLVYSSQAQIEEYKDYETLGEFKARYDKDFHYMIIENDDIKGKFAFKATDRLLDEMKKRAVLMK